MNKNMIILFFLVMFGAAIFYCYQQGCFSSEIVDVEIVLTENCDPAIEDCSDFEEDLEV